MVLHISSEMTKSLSQCPWPPAFLLVLLHSHSLMWPWTGIGHRPHSRDWYRLCCSHAYKSAELGGRLVSVWKSLSVSRLHSSTEMGGEIISAITLKQDCSLHTMFEQKLTRETLQVPQNVKMKISHWCTPTSLKTNTFYFTKRSNILTLHILQMRHVDYRKEIKLVISIS